MNVGQDVICLSSGGEEMDENFSQSKIITESRNSSSLLKRRRKQAHSLSDSDDSYGNDPSPSSDDEHFLSNALPSLDELYAKSLRCKADIHSLSSSGDRASTGLSSSNEDLQNNLLGSGGPSEENFSAKDWNLSSMRVESVEATNKSEVVSERSLGTKSKGKNICKGKEEKAAEKQKKREEKELSKSLKDIHREIKQKNSPEERIKLMRLVLDSHLRKIPNYDDLFAALHAFDFKITEECNPIPFSVIWYRVVTEVSIENNKARKVLSEEPENLLLIYITSSSFVEMVQASIQKRKGASSHCQTLLDYIAGMKQSLPAVDITCVIIGVQNYLREMWEERRRNKDMNGREKYNLPNVSKKDIEEAMIEVQIQVSVNFRLLDDINQFVKLLGMYSKALVEAPVKREKHQQQGFSWYADADSSCPVKIAKDGTGLVNLWQQQILQFQNVGKEVAQAIAAKYPSPMLLMEAYQKCLSKQEAEKLLQDIVIRRGFGPLGTTRRIGPELSYKIYLFFTSKDKNQLIQR